MAKESAAHIQWVKENTTRIAVKLNNNTDADILNRLETVESKQGYIKQALRAYIAQERNQKE